MEEGHAEARRLSQDEGHDAEAEEAQAERERKLECEQLSAEASGCED